MIMKSDNLIIIGALAVLVSTLGWFILTTYHNASYTGVQMHNDTNLKAQIAKSLQAQELAVAKNVTKCLPIYGMHNGVLCLPENQKEVNKVRNSGNVSV